MHEYPQEHRDDEDDRAGLNHEGLCSLPDVNQDTLHGRHVVRRKLHDKGGRIARKVVHLLQRDTGEDYDCETQEVHARRHKVVGREEGNCHHCDDLHLRRAGQEGREDDGHASVLLVLDGSGRHDSRNTAARSDQHRDKGLTGETETTEHAVHDECDTRHVARVLEEGQEEEQN